MNKYTLLAALILAQIAILCYQLSRSKPLAQESVAQALLAIEPESIEALSIQDAAGQTVRLQKVDQQWQTSDGFLAQQEKVEQLIEKITRLKTNLATAHTDTAAQRFQVAEDAFQRMLKIQTNTSDSVQLYLGSGAGARRSHVRLATEKAIYSLPLAEYELPIQASDWQDLNCLRLATDSVKLIELDGLTLLKIATDKAQTAAINDAASEPKKAAVPATEWIGKTPTGEIDLRSDAVASAVRHMTQLRIEQADQRAINSLNERFRLTLQHANGRRDYQLFQNPDEASQYWLQVSDMEGFALRMSETDAQQILENWALAKLIVPAEPAQEKASEASSDSAAAAAASLAEEPTATEPATTRE